MLRFEQVSLNFGGIAALNDVSFTVPEGQICGLIGPNGAGKTSLFNCVTRVYQPGSGRIMLGEVDLLSVAAREIAAHGIGRTYQNVALFATMTVVENTMVGAHSRDTPGFLRSLAGTMGVRKDTRAVRDEAMDVLRWLELESIADTVVDGLPFGTLKRIELARALMGRPRMLLLDEPAGGLTREEVTELGEVILGARERYDLSVLMIEHHLGLVGQVCDHLVALNFGELLVEGSPKSVQSHPDVVRAYIGDLA